MDKKFSLMDYIALLRLSCRHYYWNISYAGKGSITLKRLGQLFTSMANGDYGTAFVLFVAYSLVVDTIGVNFFKILSWLPAIPAYIAKGRIVAILGVIIVRLAAMAFGFFVLLNPKRLKRSLRYKESAFFKNTGIRPKEVVKDKGLCGEYLATCVEEEAFKANNIEGQIFNSVIIPQHGGNFSEADVVSVSSMGINVIEVKALGGEIEGGETWELWQQTLGKETYEFRNPILQNNTHVNYLLAYLEDSMKASGYKPGVALSHSTINSVLFLDNKVSLDINSFNGLNLLYLYGTTHGYADIYKDFKRKNVINLYKNDIDYIAKEIKKLSSHSPSEIDAMMSNRQAAIDRGEYKYPSVYHIAYCEFDIVRREGGICLIKEQNGYQFYFDPKDNWFKYVSTMRITRIEASYRSYDEAMRAFNSPSIASQRYLVKYLY